MSRRFFSCTHEALEVRHLLAASSFESPEALIDAGWEAAPLHDEGITYPGNVVVTPHEVITHSDTIPRFAAQPTVTTIRSGNWFDPSIWSTNRVPSHNDRVLIQSGQLVLYSSTSTARIAAVEVAGRLVFSTNVDTKLVVGTLTVMPTGTLQIGSQAVPVSPDVTAEIVIADRPLNLTTDPRQYGTGLLAFGKVSIFGSQLAQTWTRLAAQPRAGASYLVLEQADDRWQPGDTLVLPDTRQVGSIESDVFTSGNLPPQWEEITVRRVVGNRVYLSKPLAFDHLGARDATGKLVLLPHVAILNRNVVIRSENPNGTRGHVMLLARADVDIEYAPFSESGSHRRFATAGQYGDRCRGEPGAPWRQSSRSLRRTLASFDRP